MASTSQAPPAFARSRRRWLWLAGLAAGLGLAAWLCLRATARPRTEVEAKLEGLLRDIRQSERNETKPFVWVEGLETWPWPFPVLAGVILGEPDYVTEYEIEELGEEVIPRLMKAVSDDRSREVRRTAIEVLINLEAYEAVPIITNAMVRDRAADVREAAASAFGWQLQDGRAVPALIAVLAEDDEEAVRVAAAQSLSEHPEERVAAPLIQALAADASELVRAAAARAMDGAAQPGTLLALAHAAEQDKSTEVRTAAVWSLGGAVLPAESAPSRLAPADSTDASGDRSLIQHPDALIVRTNVLSVLRHAMTRDRVCVRGEAAGSLAALGGDAVADELIEALQAEWDAEARSRMVAALSRLDAPEARAAFISALENDPVSQVRRGAAEALMYRQATWALPHLTAVLAHDPDAEVRRVAANALGNIGGPNIAEGLMQALRTDPDWTVRHEVAGALGSSESREAVPLLVAILTARDAYLQLRAKAAEALGQLGFAESLEPLIAALREVSEGLSTPEPNNSTLSLAELRLGGPPINRWKFNGLRQVAGESVDQVLARMRWLESHRLADPETERLMGEARDSLLVILNGEYDPDARAAAGRSLGYCGGGEVFAALSARVTAEESSVVVQGVVEGLARLGDPAALSVISGTLGRDPELNVAALRALTRLGLPEAAPLVMPYLTSDKSEERVEAAGALGRLGGADQVEALAAGLEGDRSAEVRSACATALGFLGDKRAVAALSIAIEDRRDAVREPAIWALGHLGSREATPALLNMLGSERSQSGFLAALALAEVGDPEAIPALAAQLTHHDPLNQLAAALSLAFFGNDSGFGRLATALEPPPGADWHSFAAVMGLVRLHSDNARAVLAAVETDPATAFGRLIARARVESGVAVFVPCLLEDNRDYRLYTVHALRLFDDPAGIGALRVVLNDPDEEVRDMARLTYRRLLRRHTAP